VQGEVCANKKLVSQAFLYSFLQNARENGTTARDKFTNPDLTAAGLLICEELDQRR
jgi:hypothetical protein